MTIQYFIFYKVHVGVVSRNDIWIKGKKYFIKWTCTSLENSHVFLCDNQRIACVGVTLINRKERVTAKVYADVTCLIRLSTPNKTKNMVSPVQ